MRCIVAEVPDDVVEHFSITLETMNPLVLDSAERSFGVNHVVFGHLQKYSLKTVRDLAKVLDTSRDYL